MVHHREYITQVEPYLPRYSWIGENEPRALFSPLWMELSRGEYSYVRLPSAQLQPCHRPTKLGRRGSRQPSPAEVHSGVHQSALSRLLRRGCTLPTHIASILILHATYIHPGHTCTRLHAGASRLTGQGKVHRSHSRSVRPDRGPGGLRTAPAESQSLRLVLPPPSKRRLATRAPALIRRSPSLRVLRPPSGRTPTRRNPMYTRLHGSVPFPPRLFSSAARVKGGADKGREPQPEPALPCDDDNDDDDL